MENGIFSNPLVKKILKRYEDLWALNYAGAVMAWDTETYMPEGAIAERSLVFGKLSVLRQRLLLHPEFVDLVEKAEKEENLNDYERGVVRVLKRAIEKLKKLPPDFVEEFSKTVNESKVYWRKAKSKNDYKLFAPYLEKIIELSRKRAEYLGYEEHPYDALLDYYEEGLLTREVDNLFSRLKPRIKSLYKRVLDSPKFIEKHPLEEEKYDVEKMKELNKFIIKEFGFPFNHGRIDVSAHPFTIGIGIKDVRITSRYAGIDFRRSLLATIHEFGHALYNLQIDERFIGTPIANGASYSIHESQSRFWENMIGRSKTFIEVYYDQMKKFLPFLSKYDVLDIYRYFNLVRPELIRVESDEISYHLHIILRFELEKSFMENSVDVNELPELWNSKIEEYIGVRPKTYSEGILQDIHWAQGSIGYFPTYSMGTILSVQLAKKMESDLGRLDEKIVNKEYDEIKRWLKEKIHRWGSVYPPKELIRKVMGEDIIIEPLINHLENKFREIY